MLTVASCPIVTVRPWRTCEAKPAKVVRTSYVPGSIAVARRPPALIRHDLAREAGFDIHHQDADAGHHGALFVSNGSLNS